MTRSKTQLVSKQRKASGVRASFNIYGICRLVDSGSERGRAGRHWAPGHTTGCIEWALPRIAEGIGRTGQTARVSWVVVFMAKCDGLVHVSGPGASVCRYGWLLAVGVGASSGLATRRSGWGPSVHIFQIALDSAARDEQDRGLSRRLSNDTPFSCHQVEKIDVGKALVARRCQPAFQSSRDGPGRGDDGISVRGV